MAKTPDPPSPYNTAMTVREVARRDGCSEKSVRRAIDAGLLEAIRIGPSGRSIRITREAHERYRRLRRR
ncbi:MAG: helix-turn-helix domain-containing protein [Pseudomonadota bacterium]